MKILLKYTLILAASVFLTIACRDEDAVRFPELQNGINARVVVQSDKLVLNFLDIANASTAFDIYSVNKDIDELTYSATYTDATYPSQKFPTVEIKKVPGSAFSNGKASVTITAVELAEAFNLPGGGAYLDGGDNFTFFASAKLKDGRTFTAANSASSIATGTNSSFTTTWKLYVSCPFSAAEAAGTYRVTADPGEWVQGAPDPAVYDRDVEIVAGPGTNQVTIKNAFGYDVVYDVIVDVDPATGITTVAKQEAWTPVYWGFPDDKGYVSATSGFFFSCSGFTSINFTWTTGPYLYNYKIDYTKQ